MNVKTFLRGGCGRARSGAVIPETTFCVTRVASARGVFDFAARRLVRRRVGIRLNNLCRVPMVRLRIVYFVRPRVHITSGTALVILLRSKRERSPVTARCRAG